MGEPPDTTAAFNQVQRHLLIAMDELFTGVGFEVDLITAGADAPLTSGETVASIIGYGGDAARGALVLLTSRAVVHALQPEDVRAELEDDDDATCDTLGEFANMLLGRVKNRLLGHGIALVVTTPTTAIGEALRISTPTEAVVVWHEFSSTAGPLFVRFDATFDPNFVFAKTSAPERQAIAEGDQMMF